MVDLVLGWGGDLSSSESGDLATVSAPDLGTARVLRRLLTNPGAYVWQPGYGAGLARFVGEPVDADEVEAVIRGQMLLESAVARSPEPVISVQLDPGGSLFVSIRYADADTGQASTMNMQVSW